MDQAVVTNPNSGSFNPFNGPEIVCIIPNTPSQLEIWTACMFGGDDANRAYNESVSVILNGTLNKKALVDAINTIVKRHEALRATFSADGRFMIVFNKNAENIFYEDLSQLNEIDKNNAITNYLLNDANYVFNLVKGPLFKIGLLKISEQEHQIIFTAHHIICDGWSIGIFLEELGAFYSSYNLGISANVPQPETFSDYANLQDQFIESDAFTKTQNYWLKQYEDSVPLVTLPTDFTRPKLRTFKGNRLDFNLDKDIVTLLKKVGIQSGASFVVTLLAAFEVFLYKETKQNDLVLGLPAAGQALSGKTQLIGHCVNLLPLRSKLTKNTLFSNYLKHRKTEIFDAYEHQQFSFGQLLQKLAIVRDPSRVPLVPIMFNIDMGMTSQVTFNGLDFKVLSNPRTFEAFELFLNISGSENALILEWSYNALLFKPSTIEQMMASFKEVLNDIISNPNANIGDLIKLDDSAYVTLNNTLSIYPQWPLHELLAQQTKNNPKKTALKFNNQELNYEDFDKQVNQFANYLVNTGVAHGNYVAVLLPRSLELVVALVAIMKCGAAYLPLDPHFPSKRLEFMMEDSEAPFLITNKALSTTFKTTSKVIVLDDINTELSKFSIASVNSTISINDVAYIMYTSGSTGNPKGVMVTHKNLVNFLYSMMHAPGIEVTDTLLSITTISFDIAGLELFLPLLKGASLVIANSETAKDSRLMLELLTQEHITMLQATPTTWQMLLDAGWEQPLPIKALCGGEALPIDLAKKILEKVNELWNVYGPTETTIWSAIKKINDNDNTITIGQPIANTQLYLVNEQNQLVEPNNIGEICIAGDGVSKGYWKRPDLNNEKFITNPFDNDKNPVLYRTGDLGKLLPNGDVQCLGRIDHQVKIRGHRIELGEIEQAINTLTNVNTSVVVVNNNALVAHVIPTINVSEPEISSWKTALSNMLPAHMVPQQFNLLSSFPTTPNGKIDRKALIQNSAINTTHKTSLNTAKTNSEQLIATIWQDCLKINDIDIQSDFFEIGGHSLIAVKIMALIEKQTGNRLPLASLLEYPTIQKLAAYMDSKSVSWDSLVPFKTQGHKPPLFIVHGANYNILIFKNLAENLDENQPVYALQAKGLNGEIEPHDSVEAMAAHYISEIKSVYPNGPYCLGGFSFGGIIAFEMAKQLTANGDKVKNIALFDSYVYPHYYYSNRFTKKMILQLYEVSHLIFMGLNMFSSIKNFKRRIHLLKIKATGWYLKFKYGSEKQQQLQFERSSKIDDYHKKAYSSYTMEPQDVKVDLFRSTENVFFAHDYDTLGWKKLALKGIQKHMIAGNHTEMFHPPSVETLGISVQQVLDIDGSENE